MEHGTFERLTLDFDRDAFPCKQLYLCDNGELWWDLDFLHVDLLQHGVVDQKFKFVSQFRGLGDATALLAGCVFLHTASLATPACNLCANVCTSLALLFFFSGSQLIVLAVGPLSNAIGIIWSTLLADAVM
jgi:hypothetical protein